VDWRKLTFRVELRQLFATLSFRVGVNPAPRSLSENLASVGSLIALYEVG
jgi:hypothetical protein